MSTKPEPTELCQRPDNCPTAGIVPAWFDRRKRTTQTSCRGFQPCMAASTLRVTSTKDGRSSHPLYVLLRAMIRWCTPGDPFYEAGVEVHQEWVRSPLLFYAYIEQEMPCPSLSERVTRPRGRRTRRYWLWRIDPQRNYEPGNLCWRDVLEHAPDEQSQVDVPVSEPTAEDVKRRAALDELDRILDGEVPLWARLDGE